MPTKPGQKAPPKPKDAPEEEQEEGEGEEPSYMTAEQVNAAITKAFGRFARRQLPKILESSLADTLSKAGIGRAGEGEEEPEGGEGGEGGEGEGAGAVGDGTSAPKRAAAPKQPGGAPAAPTPADRKVAKLQREMEALRAEREAERQKALRQEERTSVHEALTGAGVRKEMLGPLATWLLSEESGRMVRRDTGGKLVWAAGADTGADDVDEVAVKDGLGAWLKTETGKSYLPPRPVGGGGGPPPSGRSGGRPPNGAEGTRQAEDELLAAVLGVVGQGNLPG